MNALLVPGSVNLIFALNVWAGQSLLGLFFLFTMFIVMTAVSLHLMYKAVNDTKIRTSD